MQQTPDNLQILVAKRISVVLEQQKEKPKRQNICFSSRAEPENQSLKRQGGQGKIQKHYVASMNLTCRNSGMQEIYLLDST